MNTVYLPLVTGDIDETVIVTYSPKYKKYQQKIRSRQILETLRGMNMTLLSKNSGYIPSYKRTLLTDALHDIFGFRTDYEFISKSSMRNIIKETKAKKAKKQKYSTYQYKRKTVTSLVFTGGLAVL